ncbi:MAG: DUF4340 domain-containing protein [Acidobacteriota bacterium]
MKRLLIATAVLAVLGGFIFWSNKLEEAKKDEPNPKAPKILTLKEEDIRGIEVQRKDEPPTLLKRDDVGKWTIASPLAVAADMQVVSAITAGASNLNADHVVDEKATGLASYGLDPATVSLTLTTKDGKPHRLRLGDETPDKSGVYAVIDGDPRLFAIATFARETYNKSAMDLREKRLMTFTPDKVSHVELNVSGKPPIEFGRQDDQWQITKPRPMRADKLTVEELVRVAHEAQIDPTMDEKQSTAAFTSAKPLATVRLTADTGIQNFELRQAGSDYFGRSSSVTGAFKVAATVGDGLNKKLEDFQNKKLFDFGFDDPSKVEIKIKDDTKVFEKNVGKSAALWLSNGRTMDSVAVQNLIDKLRELSASRIDDVAPATAEILITVTSNNGKRVETVQIAPSGPDFLAKREKEPQFYRIDGSAITALKEALASVREAAPEPPAKK